MKHPLALIAFTLLPAIALAAGNHSGGHATTPPAGTPGDAAHATRSIKVTMDDSMRFAPDHITVKAGETIRFVVSNIGQVTHEMVIGSMSELKAHAEMMRKYPGMEHEEPNMVTLQPGHQGELVWRFDQPGSVDFACLIPGHMEAGMIAKVTVTK